MSLLHLPHHDSSPVQVSDEAPGDSATRPPSGSDVEDRAEGIVGPAAAGPRLDVWVLTTE